MVRMHEVFEDFKENWIRENLQHTDVANTIYTQRGERFAAYILDQDAMEIWFYAPENDVVLRFFRDDITDIVVELSKVEILVRKVLKYGAIS